MCSMAGRPREESAPTLRLCFERAFIAGIAAQHARDARHAAAS